MGSRPIFLLCAAVFVNTFSVGAFPVLLPEIGRSGGLSDLALGTVAGAFGLARVVADIPMGLLVARHLHRSMIAVPCVLAVGVLLVASDGPLLALVLGRALIGAGHALGMLISLTVILLHRDEYTLSFSLGAFDMAGVLGVLGGTAVVGVLPSTLPWHIAFLIACSPQVLGFLLLPALIAALPADAPHGYQPLRAIAPPSTRSGSVVVPVAFAAGIIIALAWSAVGQFILPIRADRQFGLGRGGVASLLALLQLVEALFALPLGIMADRRGRTGTLGIALVFLAVGISLVAFAPLGLAVIGCVLFGIGLAGWNLPLSILRKHTPPQRLGWRTAQYRVAVDAGIFLGPFLSGVLGGGPLWMLSAGCATMLGVLGIAILLRRE